MAVEKQIYLDIIRTALLNQSDESVRYESSCLLTLLIFDEIINLKENKDNNVALPDFVVKR